MEERQYLSSSEVEAEDIDGGASRRPRGRDRHSTQIVEVLRQLKEDVVPLDRNSVEGKTKWKQMVDNMCTQMEEEDLAHRDQSHERVDSSQVGADIYANKWTKKVASFQNPEKDVDKFQDVEAKVKHGKLPGVSWTWTWSHSVTFYFSGLLAGLLLSSMLFAVSNIGRDDDNDSVGASILTKGQAVMALHSLVTTGIMLVVMVGFISSVLPLQGSVRMRMADLERIFYHFLPVALILICHYLNKALELQNMECNAYMQLTPENSAMVHQSYNCLHRPGPPGFMFLHLLPWLATMGIYTYLHLRIIASAPPTPGASLRSSSGSMSTSSDK